MALTSLVLLVACGDPAPLPTPGPPATSTDAPVAGPAAPSRTPLGLELGQPGTDVDAWLNTRTLPCPGEASPHDHSTRWSCLGDFEPATFPERLQRGRLAEVTISRIEDGPVHHLSLTRRYSVSTAAAEDLDQTIAAITRGWGPPTSTRKPPDAAALDSRLVWYPTTWAFADLTVEVALMRFDTDFLAVTERWSLPGVRPDPREGAPMVHGAGMRSETLPGGVPADLGPRPPGTTAIADVWGQRASFGTTPIRVWGVVHKATHGVFGASWYHLRDGTGDPEAETHDLTITSSDDTFQAGDRVIAEGPVTLDKSLGFGYDYPVILENARITRHTP